jgi:glyoxylase-like metal-dependent hydrolase (beta-lactamase superfamily II)
MEQLADRVYVETAYDGVNVGAILTQDGPVAIDVPSYPRDARDWATRLHTLNRRSVQFVALTDCHGDRILNTRWFSAPIIAHRATADRLNSYDKRYPQSLLDSLLARNPTGGRLLSNSPVERVTLSFDQDLRLIKGEFEVEFVAAPGPTPGNIWVYLPQAGILFAGDTITAGRHPLLAEANSEQWLSTLERLKQWPQEIKVIVSGRGPLCDVNAVQPVRNYIVQMRERIQQHCLEKRVRTETAAYVPEFLSMFPLNSYPPEWMQRQIRLSLERVYDEIQLAQNRGT